MLYSNNKDIEIINRLRKLKEKYATYKSRIPTQYLNIVELHRDVLERNGLLEEFNLKSNPGSRKIHANHRRETILNHEHKIQRAAKENIIRKETKPTSRPSNKDLEIINRLRKFKLKFASHKGGIPTQYLNIVELHRDVLERNDLLEEFNLKRRHHSQSTHSYHISKEQIFNSELNISCVKKYYTSDITFVKSHYRRNRNGTLSIVRGHTRML